MALNGYGMLNLPTTMTPTTSRATTPSSLTNIGAIADRRNTTSSATPASATPSGFGTIAAGRYTQTGQPATVDSGSPPPSGGGYSQAPAAPPPVPTSADALNTPDYMAAVAALRNASELFSADQASAKNRFNVDYENAVRNLGWIPDAAGGGKWDEGDLFATQGKQTASGQAFSGQLNDFASRGLLQSGLFAAQRNALQNEMSDRLKSQEQTRTRFTEDLATKERNFQAEQERARMDALNAAKQNLMSQYLAQYGGA